MCSKLGAQAFTLLCLTAVVSSSQAQSRTSVAVSAGQFEYDAGGDHSYSMIRIEVNRQLTTGLAVALGVSRARIGQIKHWFALPTDETVSHFYTGLEGRLIRPFRASTTPIINHLSFAARVNAGWGRSSGVELDSTVLDPNDEFLSPSLSADGSGFSWGGGLRASLELDSHLAFTADLMYWRDHMFGGGLDNFEKTLGVTLSW